MISPVVVSFAHRCRVVGQKHVAVVAIVFLEREITVRKLQDHESADAGHLPAWWMRGPKIGVGGV